MKKLFNSIFIITIISILISCNKSDSVKTYFYTSNLKISANHSVFVDDKLVGILPYLAIEKISVDNPSSTKLYTDLKYGKHLITVKDSIGNITNSLNMEISVSNVSTSNNIGEYNQFFKDSFSGKRIVLRFN